MVEEVQQQVTTTQGEVHSRREADHQEWGSRLRELGTQLADVREEAQKQLLTLTDTLSGTQFRLAEIGASAGRVQSCMEEVSADLVKCRNSSETSMAELRRELRADDERLESTWKRQLTDLRGDWQQQLDIVRADAAAVSQKDVEDVSHHVGRLERSVDVQLTELREHLRERLREQAQDVSKQRADDQGAVEERLQSLARHHDSVRNELSKAVAGAREARSETERICCLRIEEIVHSHDARYNEFKDACSVSLAEASAELHREIQSVRAAVADQAMQAVGRAEQLANEVQKQTGARSDDLKRDIEDLGFKVEEQLTAISASSRNGLQEMRQELRQHMVRQLDDRLRPLSDRLTEAVGECKAARRSESDIGHRCDRLQQTCSELVATQQSLTQQCSTNAQELSEIRVELRGEIQVRQDTHWRRERGFANRERSADHRGLREELHSEEAVRISSKLHGEEPMRSQSQDRWGNSCPTLDFQRHRPRATFETVLAASPLRSRTPSPALQPGSRLEDTWTFGPRSSPESLGSARSHLRPATGALSTASSRSPRSFRVGLGTYL
jgi:uncharacterized phage infection (PIP) family protein YhgE